MKWNSTFAEIILPLLCKNFKYIFPSLQSHFAQAYRIAQFCVRKLLLPYCVVKGGLDWFKPDEVCAF